MIWCFSHERLGALYGSPVNDQSGTIYLPGLDFFALKQDGTVLWTYPIYGWGESAPAIAPDGTIYYSDAFGSHNYLYAFNPNGTVKWTYYTAHDGYSSPAIAPDGTIYFGNGNCITAVNPNGTLRWEYQTGLVVYSSPAIGDDGTIYCGSHDSYLYALYPDNGTVKWRFKTGDWVRVSPCIGDDGTIYCVSLDNYLYAINPENGTMKWRTDVGAGADPTIGPDGTIYAGWDQLHAVNPSDGSIKWVIDAGGHIESGTPCISNDGIIYYGTFGYGGSIHAIGPDGVRLWQVQVGNCESALAIGMNGTIYVGAMDESVNGHLYAFGRGPFSINANGPYAGATNVKLQFTGTIYGGRPPYTYHWDFGDGQSSNEQNPTHSYLHAGNYTAIFTVHDNESNQSSDSAEVTIKIGPPVLTILKPVDGIYLMNVKILPCPDIVAIGPITIRVDAQQEPYGIDRVEFYIDMVLKATVREPPYIYRWWTPSFSIFQHPVVVKVYDNSGNDTGKDIVVWKFF